MGGPRLFYLDRVRGAFPESATGIVAFGVVWPDGTVSMKWNSERSSFVSWASLEDAQAVHCHGDDTKFVFV